MVLNLTLEAMPERRAAIYHHTFGFASWKLPVTVGMITTTHIPSVCLDQVFLVQRYSHNIEYFICLYDSHQFTLVGQDSCIGTGFFKLNPSKSISSLDWYSSAVLPNLYQASSKTSTAVECA